MCYSDALALYIRAGCLAEVLAGALLMGHAKKLTYLQTASTHDL